MSTMTDLATFLGTDSESAAKMARIFDTADVAGGFCAADSTCFSAETDEMVKDHFSITNSEREAIRNYPGRDAAKLDATAARQALHHLHHFLHLLELLQQLVDLDDLHAGALGDALTAVAVENVRLLSLIHI